MKKWIQGANIKKGALTRQAAASGKTLNEFIAHPPKNASATTKRRIALAKTFRKMAK